MRSSITRLSFGLLVGLWPAPALAQAGPRPSNDAAQGVRSLRGASADYEVEFHEDALHALEHGQNIPRIRVRPGPSRTMFMRARTSFVSEMLKSVETL